MDRSKVKALIVAGNVIGVIAIVSIILLHNYKTQSITVEDDKPKEDKHEEMETTKTIELMWPLRQYQDVSYVESHESKKDLEEKESDEEEGLDEEKELNEEDALAEEEDSEKEENKDENEANSDDTDLDTTTDNDSDGDGLSDEKELAIVTDPGNPDTDSDGLGDGEEMELGTDPNHNDSDRDGLRDGDEVSGGTDPLKDSRSSSSSTSSSDNNTNDKKLDKKKVGKPVSDKVELEPKAKPEPKPKPESKSLLEEVKSTLKNYQVTEHGDEIRISAKDGNGLAYIINRNVNFHAGTEYANEIDDISAKLATIGIY